MDRIEKIKLAISKGYTYDHITGFLHNRKGEIIKARCSNGYVMIGLKVNKKTYSLKVHQLAYYMYYNELCEEIDHINGDRTDNRISNLRSVTKQQNQWNRTKAKGYYFHKRENKYRVSISRDGVNIYIGNFTTEEEAREAYLNAKKKYHIIDE